MDVVLTTWGSRGDVEPVAALARALREEGARVRVCAPPDPELTALTERAGAEPVPFGFDVRSVVAGDRAPTHDDAVRLAAALVDARVETLMAATEGADVLVATGLMPAGARTVAEVRGARYVLACLHTYGLPSSVFPPGRRPGPQAPEGSDLPTRWRYDAENVDALYAGALRAQHARLGLPPVASVRDHTFAGGGLLGADPLLVPWADQVDLDLVTTGAWVLPDGRPLAPELEAFLDAGAPPVYVGFGSMGLHAAPDAARVALMAARRHGRRVVLARGWAGTDVATEDDCLVVGEVNQQALFGRVAAVVHHGGIGTTTTAARAGAPQVVVPQMADQPLAASRVAELGIGAAHDGPAPTVDSLAAVLGLALAPQVAERAAAAAAGMIADGAARAAKLLLSGYASPATTTGRTGAAG